MAKTLQEHFDFVVSNLLKQNRRSAYDHNGKYPSCLYRGPDGTKCAAGWVIDDHSYKTDMEGSGVGDVVSIWPDAFPEELRRGEGLTMLMSLQVIHDAHKVADWRASFAAAARERGLSDAVCKPVSA